MSFLFPNRACQRIKITLITLSKDYDKSITDQSSEKTPSDAHKQLNEIWDSIDRKEKRFEQKTTKWRDWFRSFLYPDSSPYKARKAFAAAIEKNKPVIEKLIANYDNIPFKNISPALYRTFLNARTFRSWETVIFLTIFMLLALGTGLIGLGALLQCLGVSLTATSLTFFAQASFTLLSGLATQLAVSTFGLSVAIMAAGVFLAGLSFSELDWPGSLFSFFGIGYDPNRSGILQSHNHLRDIGDFIPILGPLWILFFNKELTKGDKQASKRHLVSTLFNPITFIYCLLLILSRILCQLVDLGTQEGSDSSIPRILIKGVIDIPCSIIFYSLLPLKKLIDLPIDAAWYLLEKCIPSDKDQRSDREDEDAVRISRSDSSDIQSIDQEDSQEEATVSYYSDPEKTAKAGKTGAKAPLITTATPTPTPT